MNVRLTVNGRGYSLVLDPRESLLDVLRERLGLTGTKKGCDQGACGACTVHVDGRRVLSCLTLAARCEGKQVGNDRGSRQERRGAPTAARDDRARRAAVWLLHSGADHVRHRAARRGTCEDAGRDPRMDERQPLLARLVAGPAGHVEDDRLDARRLDDDLDELRELPGQSPE